MPTFTGTPVYPPTASYTGYKKSAVLSKWQQQLQLQQYETACHWTAEADASGWHDDVWAKLVAYASKHVHVHSPTLPTLLARNFAYYRHHAHVHGTATSSNAAVQPRNDAQLRQNLCQAVGLVALSPKGPVYALPKVDPARVDETKIVTGTHAWLLPHATTGDHPVVTRLLSTVLYHLEILDTPNCAYWLSVLQAFEKQQRAAKQAVTMAARRPLNDGADAFRRAVVDGKHAADWVWLLWHALHTASVSLGRPAACRKALTDLCYLFAHDYATTKRNARIALVLHAMHLVRTDTLDWTRSVYPSDDAKALIVKACTNIDVMYAGVEARAAAVRAAGQAVGANTTGGATEGCTGAGVGAGSGVVAEARAGVLAAVSDATAKGGGKPVKGAMSASSKAKMDAMAAIDDHVFLF